LGTEQTEQALQRLFAGTPVYRADSDTMTRRSSMQDLLTAIATVGPCIIVGTQLLTKGHHFPEVTCVGVLDADAQLFNPDFRGEERLAQLLTQVGGRAGRAEKPGAVIIQTRHPDHPVVQSVLAEPWQTLCDELLNQRLSQGLPPHGHLAVMRCDSRATAEGLDFLTRCVRQLGTRELTEGVRIVGPLPAAMARRAGLYRSQVILIGRARKSVHDLAARLVTIADSQKQPAGLRWFMDIDPIESL
jgi:primosomal protein N' (replication factor Y)